MTIVHIDSNVLFRLSGDETPIGTVHELQRRRALRVVIGWTTVWELSGALTKGEPGCIEKARADAGTALELLDSGGRIARSPWSVACEALALPASDRWRDRGLLARTSDDYQAAVESLRAVRDPTRDAATRAWYSQYATIAERFREHERDFLHDIRARAPGEKPDKPDGLAASLDALEVNGWLPRATAAVAARLGHRRFMPARPSSDWFGPLGRMMRASLAFSMLHATSPSSSGDRPKRSDYGDVMHVVGAGLIKRFVTKDDASKRVFDAVWPAKSRSAMRYPFDWSHFLQVKVERSTDKRRS